MAAILRMPQMGITMTEGTLSKWLVGEGDSVHAGDPLYEVETDKYNNTVESEAEGTLLKIVTPEGTDVPVHGPVAILGTAGEDITALLEPAATAAPGTVAPIQGEPAETAAEPPKRTSGGRVKASPLAKKTAQALRVSLAGLTGTGMQGRIVQADVLSAHERMTAADVPAEPTLAEGSRPVKLSAMRRAIARNMSASWSLAPMVTYHTTADVTELSAVKGKLAADGIRLSYTDFLIKAAATAQLRHPYVNSTLEGDMVTFHDYVHMGVAVAVENGLVVPVIRNAHLKDLRMISDELRDLTEKAHAGTLAPEDTSAGTFTISNLGMYGVDNFSPIIDHPQSAILGVGRICKQAVEAEGRMAFVPVLNLSLTADHRVIDGAAAAKWLQEFRLLVEHPWKLLL